VFRFCEAGEIAKQFFCNSRACFYFSYVGRGQSDLGRAAQEVGDRDLAVARDLLALGDDLLLYAAVGAHRCRVPRREVGEVSPEHGLYVLAGDDRHLLCAYFQSFDCPHRADDAVDPFGRKGRRSAQSFGHLAACELDSSSQPMACVLVAIQTRFGAATWRPRQLRLQLCTRSQLVGADSKGPIAAVSRLPRSGPSSSSAVSAALAGC